MLHDLSLRPGWTAGWLLAATLVGCWPANAGAQEMHEFFGNTRQSPAAVDYGAAYYDHWSSSPTTDKVSIGAERQAAPGSRIFSITGWLARRPSGTAYLGVQLDGRRGDEALVTRVEANSPAAQSGMRAGDVIRSVNGRLIRSLDELPRQIASLQPGERVQLAIERPSARAGQGF